MICPFAAGDAYSSGHGQDPQRGLCLQAVMPAEVQRRPAFTKMRSGCSCTRGNRRMKSVARLQWVVARFPSMIRQSCTDVPDWHPKMLPMAMSASRHDCAHDESAHSTFGAHGGIIVRSGHDPATTVDRFIEDARCRGEIGSRHRRCRAVLCAASPTTGRSSTSPATSNGA